MESRGSFSTVADDSSLSIEEAIIHLRSQGLGAIADSLIAVGPKACSNGYAIRMHMPEDCRAKQELIKRYPAVAANGYNNILLASNRTDDLCLMFANY